MYFVQSYILEFQRFCFQRSSCLSFNTSSLWCEDRIYHRMELITGQKFLVSFSSYGVLYYRRCRNNVWSLVIYDYFHETTNQLWIVNSKMTGLKDRKSCQENVSLSLAKRKLVAKNEGSFLINQIRSCMLSYTSQIAEEASFFRLPYVEYDFMIANSVRLNLVILKITETSQGIPMVECYVNKVAGIHSPIKLI